MMTEVENLEDLSIPVDFELLSQANPVFRVYVTHASLLILKMLFLGMYTIVWRLKKQVFVNLEDLPFGRLLKFNDPVIERIRRAHRNDLETTIPFLIIGFLFVLTEPIPRVAINCFRFVTFSGIIHSLVYVTYPVQSLRLATYLSTLSVSAFMAIDCVAHF